MYEIAMVAGGSAVALGSLATFVLPGERIVERSRDIDASSHEVFELLKSNAGYQQFNPWCDTDPELEVTLFGPQEGVGSGFSFAGKEGKGKQVIASLEENREVVVDIDLGLMGQPVTTFRLESTGAHTTRVTWSTRMRFGMNPLKRVFGIFADGMLGSTYERGLDNLNKVLA